MEKAYQHLLDLYCGVRDGKANPGLLDAIQVKCYGSTSPLKHLSLVTIRDKNLLVEPYDNSLLGSIEKAILQANLGLTTQKGNSSILVAVPRLFRDQREKLIKHVKKLAEEQKVAIRNIRRWLRKDKEISDARVNELTKKYMTK